MSKEVTIPFTINYDENALIAPLTNLLTEVSNSTFIGLKGIEQLTSVPDMMPTSDSFLSYLPYRQKMSIEESKSYFEKWILKKGLEDIVKGITLTLVEFCRVIDKYNKLNDVNPSTPQELYDIVYSTTPKVDSKNIHRLFDMIQDHISDNLVYKKQIISLNHVRNCLVHRNGIVTYKDIHEPSTNLQLQYSRFKITAVTEKSKRKELREPLIINLNEPIKLEIIPVLIVYEKGDSVELDFTVLNDLIITAHLFGQDLLHKFSIKLSE